MTTIKWQDPPQPTKGRAVSAKWLAIAATLRANPGRWALISDDMSTAMVSHINNGRLAALRPDEDGYFTARSSRDSTVHRSGRGDLYARYLLNNTDIDDDTEEN